MNSLAARLFKSALKHTKLLGLNEALVLRGRPPTSPLFKLETSLTYKPLNGFFYKKSTENTEKDTQSKDKHHTEKAKEGHHEHVHENKEQNLNDQHVHGKENKAQHGKEEKD